MKSVFVCIIESSDTLSEISLNSILLGGGLLPQCEISGLNNNNMVNIKYVV